MNSTFRLGQTLVLVALCALTAACGEGTPTTPSNANVAGTWVGNATVSGQSSQLRLTVAHTEGTEVSGTWAWTIGEDTAGGPLGGTVNQEAVSVTLRPANPIDQCRVNITATVAGTKMTGTYGGLTCPTNVAGAVDLTRQ